jgi:hypothetical protein
VIPRCPVCLSPAEDSPCGLPTAPMPTPQRALWHLSIQAKCATCGAEFGILVPYGLTEAQVETLRRANLEPQRTRPPGPSG